MRPRVYSEFVGLRLPEALRADLERLAVTHGLSISEWIRAEIARQAEHGLSPQGADNEA
jgi:hypothetical protein